LRGYPDLAQRVPFPTVTELNASNGAFVQTVSGGSYGFNYPDGIAFDGTHIWVTNEGNNSVTDIQAG
jgi:DNA-binding beta-propeller fold protein YncE